MFVDFHVHPNLPSFNIDSWLERWWKNIHSHKLDAVVITEHSYKNPEKAYRAMLGSRPKLSKVFVFPGVEVLTKEGIDVLAFSETDRIYDYDELVTPWGVGMDELLDFFSRHRDVIGIITHPFTPGETSIVTHKGEAYAKRAIDRLGNVEVHNGAMRGVIKVLEETGLSVLLRNKYERALKTFDLPKAFYPEKPRLLASGSDAHSPDCLGGGVKMQGKWNSKAEAFKRISSARGTVIKQQLCHPYRDMFTTLSEWWMKQWL